MTEGLVPGVSLPPPRVRPPRREIRTTYSAEEKIWFYQSLAREDTNHLSKKAKNDPPGFGMGFYNPGDCS